MYSNSFVYLCPHTMIFIHQPFNTQVNMRVMYSVQWLSVQSIKSNHSSSGLRNSWINPGVKSLQIKALFVLPLLKVSSSISVWQTWRILVFFFSYNMILFYADKTHAPSRTHKLVCCAHYKTFFFLNQLY